MRVGVVLMPVDPWPATAERARELETLGFDHLWVYDHLSWKHYRDRAWHATFPWLTGLAAVTSRIDIGTMVASPTLRHPLMLAKEAMSIDHVSQGRFILGLGAGGAGFDATAYGDRPLSPAERADRLEEYANLVDGLLRGAVTDHVGRWYHVEGGRVLPGSVRRPRLPLALAAGGRRTIALTGALADRWITLGDPTRPAEGIDDFVDVARRQSALLDRACEASGRQPTEVGRTAFLPLVFTDPMRSLDAFTDLAAALGDIGFDTIVIHDHRSDDPPLDVGTELIEAIAGWRGSQASRPTMDT
ncbi:MAG: LLM class flavin-dependent oxidoreductase [Actinomycetota bacterium]